jgi:hypothetical protein
VYLEVQKSEYVNVWTLKMNMKHKSKSNICKWRCCKSTKIEYVAQVNFEQQNSQHLELQHPTKVEATHNILNCNMQVKFKLLAAPHNIQVKFKLQNIGPASQFKRKL